MEQNRKIIFLDVDGTITDYTNKIPASTIEAIKKARENGHLVLMLTGRSKAENKKEIWDIGFDGFIGGNGSYIEIGDKVIYEKTLTLQQCTKAVNWMHENGLEFYLETNNGLFASENFCEAGAPVVQQYMLGKGMSKEQVKDITPKVVFHGMVENENLYRSDVNKISYILKDYQYHLDSKELFPELTCGTWGGKGHTALFGDIGIGATDKGVAVDMVLDYLGIDRRNSVSIGDAMVDLPMLKKTGVSIAMGNGPDELKKQVDYVTSDVDEDGIYNAFKRYELI